MRSELKRSVLVTCKTPFNLSHIRDSFLSLA